MGIMIEGVGLRKEFVVKRSIRELVTKPLGRARRVRALRGVDFQVAEGEIFGLLGPNGAGKTTLIKILSCLVLPDAGRATVDGIDTIEEDRVKPRIGLVHPDERSFYWRLSARENLRFFARLYNVPSGQIEQRIDTLLGKVEMLEAADRPFSAYSSGMKQRVSIARALLHDPPILFMDEPTRSLDPASSARLREFVHNELRGRDGKTILLATHNLQEAEELADRVAIMIEGKIRQVGTVDQVRRWGMSERLFLLELEASGQALNGPFRVLSDETVDGLRKATVALDDGANFEQLMRSLLALGVTIRACDRIEPDLEGAFSRILKAEAEDQGQDEAPPS